MPSCRLAIVPSLLMLWLACASATRLPRSLQGYEVLVSGRDSLSQALAVALRNRGVRIRREVRGGGRPTAALIHFTFREPQGGASWLHARLFDTRSGLMLGAATLPIDSAEARGRVQALVDSLLKSP